MHHPQEPQNQGGVTPPVASTSGTGAPGIPGAGQRSAAPQEHLITPATPPIGGQSGSDSSQGTKQTAKDEAANVAGSAKEQAANVAGSAKDAGRHVADTAKGEARQVVGEAKQQARQLFDQTMHEVRDQAKTQQGRAAEGMRTFSDELRGMADGSAPAQGGMASQLIGEVAQRASSAAGWLEDREPADLLEEVKRFARRRPGTFIAIAGVAGLLVGRLARGIGEEAKDQKEREARQSRSSGSTGTHGATGDYGTTDGYGSPTGYGATGGYDTTGSYGTGTAGTTGAAGTAATYGATDAAWTATAAGETTPATPVDDEPWLGERPVSDVPGVDPDLPSGDGFPTTRRETGL
ncbi:hypothetical protein [Agrococcus citreus]|uniref:Uncharacterized protein n=1 Tax=Agrococcus citreus TaxID=84643 RepID=A0ABN1YWE3_9MICO